MFFRKARDYIETNHDIWYILSAKHHLLTPDGPSIEPCNERLSGASVERKRDWARTVYKQPQDEGPLVDGDRLVFHAGDGYYDELLPPLRNTPMETETPTDGLQYGETLSGTTNGSNRIQTFCRCILRAFPKIQAGSPPRRG